MVAEPPGPIVAETVVFRLEWSSRHSWTLLSRTFLRDHFIDNPVPPPGISFAVELFSCGKVTLEVIATCPTSHPLVGMIGAPGTNCFVLPPLPPRLRPAGLVPHSAAVNDHGLGHLFNLCLRPSSNAKLLARTGLRTPKALLLPAAYVVDIARIIARHAWAANSKLLYLPATAVLRTSATRDGLLASLRAHVLAARACKPAVLLFADAQFLFPQVDEEAAAAFILATQELPAEEGVMIAVSCSPDAGAVHPTVREAVDLVLPVQEEETTDEVTKRQVVPVDNSSTHMSMLTHNKAAHESHGARRNRLVSQWDEISGQLGGLREPQRVLKTMLLWRQTRYETFAKLGVKPSSGILLYGCPGTGKTSLVRKAAAAAELTMVFVDAARIARGEVGASEKLLSKTFRKAREIRPSILFMDEIDALFASGRSGSSHLTRLVSALGLLLDSIEDDVVVIGVTNRPWAISKVLLRPGRFEHCVHVPLPNGAEREEIGKVYADKMHLGEDTRKFLLDLLAGTRADGFSGADVAGACRRAAMSAVCRESKIEECDLQRAFQESHVSVKKSDAEYLASWAPPL